jgi:hypothetical protein
LRTKGENVKEKRKRKDNEKRRVKRLWKNHNVCKKGKWGLNIDTPLEGKCHIFLEGGIIPEPKHKSLEVQLFCSSLPDIYNWLVRTIPTGEEAGYTADPIPKSSNQRKYMIKEGTKGIHWEIMLPFLGFQLLWVLKENISTLHLCMLPPSNSLIHTRRA